MFFVLWQLISCNKLSASYNNYTIITSRDNQGGSLLHFQSAGKKWWGKLTSKFSTIRALSAFKGKLKVSSVTTSFDGKFKVNISLIYIQNTNFIDLYSNSIIIKYKL